MRLPTRENRDHVGFNMTPMIDVVFLLIIFFLVASQLAQQEVNLQLELPSAQSGELPAEDQAIRVTLNVLPDGQVLLSGEPVEAGEIEQRLKFEAQRSGRDLEVRIRSDRNVPYRHIEPIMLACARAGVWNVTFSVLRSRRS